MSASRDAPSRDRSNVVVDGLLAENIGRVVHEHEEVIRNNEGVIRGALNVDLSRRKMIADLVALSTVVVPQVAPESEGRRDRDHLDRPGIRRVEALLAEVRAAGLTEAAEVLASAYWGWIRVTQSYVYAHPYVGSPEPGMTPLSALHVVDFCVRHWATLIPGSPTIDDAAVLEEARADEAWHRAEDLRMRRDAGEDI